MKDYNLIGRLRSVKRFFLLDQSDFLDQFIDLADEDLRRPVSKTVQVKICRHACATFFWARCRLFDQINYSTVFTVCEGQSLSRSTPAG